MRIKMLAIADRLEKRAKQFREPYEPLTNTTRAEFLNSPSHSIFTALDEVATAIRQELT